MRNASLLPLQAASMLIIASSLKDHAVTPNCTGGENASAEIPATKPAVFSHFRAKLTRAVRAS